MWERRIAAVAVALTISGAALAAPGDLETRVGRLERLLEGQTLVDMVTRLDALQSEVQQLRGQVEEQNHTIEGLQRRQRDLYLDIDRRMTRLEREGSDAAMAPQGESPAVEAPVGMVAVPVPDSGAGAVSGSGVDAGAPSEDPAALAKERESYQKAFDLLRELRYDQATAAFQSFLKVFPQGRYAHIAQYWLGEASYAQRNFPQAISDYQHLIDAYPRSPKLAEAMLKIGYSHYELGDKSAASKVLSELLDRFPNTTEAGQARNLLAQIKRQG